MNTLLFIPYHLASHILPTLPLSRLLKEKYKIIYAVPKKFQPLAEYHQLDYVILESVPFGYGFESVVRKQERGKNSWHDSMKDRRNGRIARHREKKLKEIIQTMKPSIILLDMLSATDFVLLYPYLKSNHASIAIINPMLSTYSNPGVPRIGSSLRPNETFKIFIENFFVRKMYHLFHLKEWIRYFGNDNRSLIKKEFSNQHISNKYRFARDNYTTIFFEEIPELILAPEELEFPGKVKKNNQHYVGILPADVKANGAKDLAMYELTQKITAWKKNPRCRIIYCAFGSMYGNASNLIYDFLKRLFIFSIEEYDLQIVCAFTDKANRIDKKTLPATIHVYDKLPQTEILSHCDLFITHAGLGSVKESIAAGVPMLAYPFTKDWDSTGNAVKIEYHGLGLKGNIITDDSSMIALRITKLLNESVFKENVERLVETITKKYTEENLMELFLKLISKQIQ